MADRPRGISVRLGTTVAATLVLAAVLSMAGLGLSVYVRHSLIASLDAASRTRALDVAALVVAGSLPAVLPAAADDADLVQVVGPRGQVLTSSANLSGQSPLLPADRPLPVHPISTTAPIGSSGEQFRLQGVPVTLPSGVGRVVVARSLAGVQASVEQITRALTLGGPPLLLLVGGVIWLAVGRTLAPVDRMSSRAAAITPNDIEQQVPVPPGNDAVARLAHTLNDLLQRLQRAHDRQRQLVADASHELKSPLAGVLSQLDVARSYPERTDHPKVLETVREETSRLAMLVDDLLVLARLDERGPALSDPVAVEELVLAEYRRLRSLGTVEVRLGPLDAAIVSGRAADLARLLRNLGDNAVAHAESQVWVGLTCDTRQVCVTVDDDGPGIPAADRERVFERFTRLDESRARPRPTSGSGLGLAISREVARAHGGDVRLTNRPDGSGTRALVTLPRRSEEPLCP